MKPEKAIIHISRAIDTIEFEAVQEAVLALEKQIPKKPVINLWDEWCECPECGGIVYFQDAKCDYCPDCGKKIDWSKEE